MSGRTVFEKSRSMVAMCFAIASSPEGGRCNPLPRASEVRLKCSTSGSYFVTSLSLSVSLRYFTLPALSTKSLNFTRNTAGSAIARMT